MNTQKAQETQETQETQKKQAQDIQNPSFNSPREPSSSQSTFSSSSAPSSPSSSSSAPLAEPSDPSFDPDDLLVVHELHKIYGEGTANEVHALRGISFTVKKGEMVAIMGPSGCGKTTLLNLIGGLDTPSSGKIYINGKDLSSFTDKEMTNFRRDYIGYVFQLFNLFDYLTAIENVMVPLLAQGYTFSRAQRKAMILLRDLGLGSRAFHKPGELSGGQQQRVAIARALVTTPVLLLGDEPTGDLDELTAKDIMKMFRRVNKEYGQTMLIVTHAKWIGEQCDRIIYLRDGQIENHSSSPSTDRSTQEVHPK